MALETMLIVQILGMTALFPIILWDWRSTVVAMLLIWPFNQLSALLASSALGDAGMASIYVSVWIAGLGLLNSLLTPRLRLLATGLLSAFAWGGVILRYLALETGRGDVGISGRIGPVLGVLAQIDGTQHRFVSWLQTTLPVVVTLVAWLFRRQFFQHPIDPISHH
jgi:hypothetical protein